MELTQNQINFIKAWNGAEQAKIAFEEVAKATEAVIAENGIGSMFQDPLSGCVFKMVEPDGRWVKFEKFGHVRTRRNGEKQGTLSLTEAKAAGFEVS